MKLRFRHKKFILFILSFLVFISSFVNFSFINKDYSDNLVIVIDVSGSMRSADSNQSAIDFAILLADIHQNKDRKIGFVAYDEDIMLAISPTFITDFNAEDIHNQLKNLTYTRNTDLGLGLTQAIQWLSNNDEIILLSDGEIDLLKSVRKRTDAQNKADQHSALQTAKEKNILIHPLILQTNQKTDMDAMASLASETGGRAFFLDSKNPLLPQFLSAYAQTQGLLLSKVATVQADETKLTRTIQLPYIDYTESLDFILFSSSRLQDCQYNDASSARINNNQNFTVISQASTSLAKQSILVSSVKQTPVDIFTLKRLSLLPVLSYEKDVFHATIVDPDTKQLLPNNEPLPVQVSILDSGKTIDTLLLTPEKNGAYNGDYTIPFGKKYTAIVSVTIENGILTGNTLSLPLHLPTLHANPTDPLLLEKEASLALDLSPFFSYAGTEPLTYSIQDSSLSTSATTFDKNTLVLEKPKAIQNGFIEITAIDIYGSTATNRIPITIQTPIINYIMPILALTLLLIALILLLILFYRRKVKHHFTGMFAGRLIRTTHGRDCPDLVWLPDTLTKKSNVTLQGLFTILNITETIPEAKHIHFVAQEDDEVLFWHNTNCIVLVESKTVHRNQKFLLHNNNRLTIIFEDATTELELYYRDNPSFSAHHGNRQLQVHMKRS